MLEDKPITLHPITFNLILSTLYKLRTYCEGVTDRYTEGPIWNQDDDAVLAILEEVQRRSDARRSES